MSAVRSASLLQIPAGLLRATIVVLLPLIVQTASGQVPYDRIRRAESEPGNWLTYSGNYQSHRHSLLTQINATNVVRLKPAWVYQIRDVEKVETSPIVLDGVLYITEKPNVVTALDGRTGRPLWSYRRSQRHFLCPLPFSDVPYSRR